MNFLESVLGPTSTEWLNQVYFVEPNWKWIALALVITMGLLLQPLAARVVLKIKKTLLLRNRTPSFLKYSLDLNLQFPIAWIITCLLSMTALDAIDFKDGLEKYLFLLVRLVLAFNLIRLVYMMTEAVGKRLGDATSQSSLDINNELISFATKSLKVFVVIFGVLITIQNFGVNVLSVLAGLGLGGLALALAAQDTAANLFGSITILLDRPFKVGDWVKVIDTEGRIESIGFRSTCIRTFYGSLVTIPNSTMAKEKIDNMGARPENRIRHLLGVTYSTPPEKIEQFCQKIELMLRQIPEINQDAITVRFNAMNDFNLQILVNCFVRVEDLAKELEIQQNILLNILKLAKQMEIEFAFPTSTQYLHHMSHDQK